MSDQKPKRAWSDFYGHIVVSPNGCGMDYGFDITCAIDLRDQLTAAIEEASKPDPFETWWNSLPKTSCGNALGLNNGGVTTKYEARVCFYAGRESVKPETK